MSGLTLTYKDSPDSLPVNVDRLLPGLDPDLFTEQFIIECSPENRLTLRNLPVVDGLGAHMSDGELVIEGDVGCELGAQMRGGIIRVMGNCGDRAGMRMRRGMITIAGSAGATPGFRMTAGTIVIGRGPYDHPGLEMRRGTIICLDGECGVGENGAFALAGEYELAAMPALSLIARSGGFDVKHNRWRLLTGDRFELNKGEVWQPAV
jgi:formylmethanofuran dehydrogenase subunit C